MKKRMKFSSSAELPKRTTFQIIQTIVATLAFDVGQLFSYEAINHFEYIHAADMSLFTCRIHPAVFPAHDAMQAHAKCLFDLDVRLRRIAEEVLPKLRDGFLSRRHNRCSSSPSFLQHHDD